MFQIRDCRGKGIEPDIKTWDPAYTVRADVVGCCGIVGDLVLEQGLFLGFKCRAEHICYWVSLGNFSSKPRP